MDAIEAGNGSHNQQKPLIMMDKGFSTHCPRAVMVLIHAGAAFPACANPFSDYDQPTIHEIAHGKDN